MQYSSRPSALPPADHVKVAVRCAELPTERQPWTPLAIATLWVGTVLLTAALINWG